MKLLTRSMIALFVASMLLSACHKTDESAGAAADNAAPATDAAAAPAASDAAAAPAAAPAEEKPASEEPGGWVPPAEDSKPAEESK
ncbi:MAG TPA: hypothetical protein VFX01_05625 [Methylophilaceae bacterium]|nr:hypothetical protein [Methylophilaceae bacterium]